jgi:hypothetical protein
VRKQPKIDRANELGGGHPGAAAPADGRKRFFDESAALVADMLKPTHRVALRGELVIAVDIHVWPFPAAPLSPTSVHPKHSSGNNHSQRTFS